MNINSFKINSFKKIKSENKIIIYIIIFIIITTVIILSLVFGYFNKGIECNDDEYLEDRTCKPCHTFADHDGIITNSCTKCDGPNPENCQHAMCVNGYYSVYNENYIQCDPCRTQEGCIDSDRRTCYNIKGVENTYKCNIGKNAEGYYINNEGISELCLEGTFSYAQEGTTSGCKECLIQEGCKPGKEKSCANIDGYKDKLECEITGNENYYIDINGISNKCEVGTYNDEETLNTTGCFPCIPQDECSYSGSSDECLTIYGFENKLFCNDTKEEIQFYYPNKTIYNGLIRNIECRTPNTTGYELTNIDGTSVSSSIELDSNLELGINVQCEPGFGGETEPQYTSCMEDNTLYTISGCEECTEQIGCNDHKETCSLIPGMKTKLECKPGASNNGYFVDYDGIVNECEVGTYSLAGEASETGCQDCIEQEGCKFIMSIV